MSLINTLKIHRLKLFGFAGVTAVISKLFYFDNKSQTQNDTHNFYTSNSDISLTPQSKTSLLTEVQVKAHPVIPLRFLSNVWGHLTSCRMPMFMRNFVYGTFCQAYDCKMDEALDSDYRSYRTFNEFFRRELKEEARPVSKENGVVSPADGLVLHFGPLNNVLHDVKGIDYSVKEFLGLKTDKLENELLQDKNNKTCLYQCIIYLAPGDYHRFHSPTNWEVHSRKHFPGLLLSVKPGMIKRMPEVLQVNERVCYFGKWKYGFYSMTAVGAFNVGSIKVNFDKELRTNRRHLFRANSYPSHEHKFSEAIKLIAGQDFGEFNFGSTIVLIFEAPKNTNFKLESNQKVKFGQLLAKIN